MRIPHIPLTLGLAVLLGAASAEPLGAQIRRHPTGVNVNANGPTTVFITFGNLDGYVPAEALWCGELVSAAPAVGERCAPGTIYGQLPLRHDLSRPSGLVPPADPGQPFASRGMPAALGRVDPARGSPSTGRPVASRGASAARPAPGRQPSGSGLQAGASNLSTLPGGGAGNALTDIMSIPQSVAARAYQAARRGENSSFFYVRRFVDPTGARPDQYVSVTCRLTGGGARTPFALTDVRLSFATEEPVLVLSPDATPPAVQARILYNGTGQLRGRWEVVLPGEEPPSAEDLLTEATLPIELRGRQRRYTEVGRFNAFLPPTGEFTLPGPDASRLPTFSHGQYLLLLRIEASDDKEGDSSLDAAGAGQGVVHTGAVAGFPIPPLRYYVGGEPVAATGFRLLAPEAETVLPPDQPLDFSWVPASAALLYRLEIASGDDVVLEALVAAEVAGYRAPSWLRERVVDGEFRWRVVALGANGREMSATPWRTGKLDPND